jgi:hypothetical protein
MSLIKANAVQVGQSPTATQNFTLAVPSSPDGTIKLARGNAGATTQDVLSVDASGNVSINGISLGKGGGNISSNTAIGNNALQNNTTGGANTSVGYFAGSQITIGSQNTAIGKSALETMQAGNNNTAIGFSSLKYANDATAIQNTCVGAFCGEQISTGNNNTAIGHNTLKTLTTGDLNSAVGQGSLAYCVTGNYNTAMGYHALLNHTGDNGVAFGVEALRDLTTGLNNTAVGFGALKSIVTSASNTALGHLAGQVITSGQNTCVGDSAMFATTTGSANTAIGHNALVSNQTGQHNSAIGSQSLISNISGSRNVAVGRVTLINATGSDNTAIGTTALNACTSGIANTALGGQSLMNLVTFDNCTGLGFNSQVTGSNQIQLGDASTTTYAYGAVQNRSDIRDKADVRDTTLGLEFVNALRPVDFKWDLREDYRPEAPKSVAKPTELKEEASDEDKAKYAEELAAYNAYVVLKDKWLEDVKLANITHDGSKKRNRFHHGLIAQEVKAVLDAKGIDFGGFQDHKVKGGDDVLSIGYEELIAPLVKAVQELSAKVTALESK